MSRIAGRFQQLAEQGRTALIPYIVAGDPGLDVTVALMHELVDSGADIIEVGVPFSDPMADGPVILKANADALSHGARVDRSFEIAEKITARFDIPFLFMTYYNILFRRGVESFVDRMAEIGICGAIVPDLPPEEGVKAQRSR